MELTALLEEAAHGETTLQLPGCGPVPGEVLWAEAEVIAGWLYATYPPGSTVAVALRAHRNAITLLLGAWRAGCTVASLPQRSRNTPTETYRAQLRSALRTSGAVALFVDRSESDGLGPLDGLAIHTLDAIPTTAHRAPTCEDAALVQFSSGSTGEPKGVRLSNRALVANTGYILTVLDPDDCLVTYSWLPLSHDMGLIGTFLTAWLAGAPSRLGRTTIVLDEPETFTRSPGSWLHRCAEVGANSTAGPTFAYDLVARRFPRPAPDLRRLRHLIIGAEPVRADVLRRFSEAASDTGLSPTAMRPAYGLAETAVAATMTPADVPWRALTVDPAALACGRVVHSPAGRELISNGPPIPGTEVRISAGPGDVGVIELRGPSLMDGYLGGANQASDEWFATGDLGFIEDGELYVVGRNDDRLIVAGRNIYPSDVEHAARTVDDIRGPLVAAIDDGRGKFRVVASLRRSRLDSAAAHIVAVAVRRAVGAEVGLTPSSVTFVSPRSFPLTPSGKVQRRAVVAGLADGSLASVHHFSFGSDRANGARSSTQ